MARRRKVAKAAKSRAAAPTNRTVSPLPFVGMGLMAAVLFLYGYAAVIVPWYVLVPMLLLWLFFALECARAARARPKRLIWIPIAATAVWAGIVIGGGLAFDWEPAWDPGTGGKVPNRALG